MVLSPFVLAAAIVIKAYDYDDRITPVGRIIRAIRFDELPG